jgi:hypothetical protein
MMNIQNLISLIHVFIIVPFLLYCVSKGNNMSIYLKYALQIFGGFIILFHGYRILTNPLTFSVIRMINWFHLFIIGPLLVYIGYTAPNTNAKYYDYLAIIAYAALIYHGYYLGKAYL